MKRYRLAGWPELPSVYQRTAYQRMLHRMSHRPASLRQLVRESGLQTSAVRDFLDTLSQQELLIEDDPASSPTLLGWIRLRFDSAAPR